jgi:hypothetical protein
MIIVTTATSCSFPLLHRMEERGRGEEGPLRAAAQRPMILSNLILSSQIFWLRLRCSVLQPSKLFAGCDEISYGNKTPLDG